jgi:hypothetical protein
VGFPPGLLDFCQTVDCAAGQPCETREGSAAARFDRLYLDGSRLTRRRRCFRDSISLIWLID